MALISIVSPVFHNAASLPDLLAAFQALAGRCPDDGFEFVFVDDGSADDSFAVLERLAGTEPRMRVVRLARNFGSNAAILAGLAHARGAAVAVIAADLQDPPELLDEMLAHWRRGSKVVLAARASRDDPRLSALLADTFYRLFRRFAIKSMPRGGFDFFLIDRQVCDLIKGIQESNAYLMGLVLWLGFDPVVIPYHRGERKKQYGQSMWTLARKLKYFVDSFVAFSYMPIRAASLLGVTLSGLGLCYAVWVLCLALFWETDVGGWASLMIVTLLIGGVQMVMMGILGEYLWRNLEETRRRPRYVVDRLIEARTDQANTDETRKAA